MAQRKSTRMMRSAMTAIAWLMIVQAAVAPALAAVPNGDLEAEGQLVAWLNQAREAHGREPLARNAALDALARLKAQDMVEERYFDHVSPRYGTVFDMLTDAGIRYKWAGENIARASSARVAHDALMESQDHRANILSAGYSEVGVGVVRYGGKVYVCQIFMRPRI